MGFSACRCSILSFECINVKWREHHEWTCGHETWLILTIWPGLQTCLMCALAFSHHSAHMWVEKRISAKKCYQKFLLFAPLQQDKKIIPSESMNTSSFSLFGQAWTSWHGQHCWVEYIRWHCASRRIPGLLIIFSRLKRAMQRQHLHR